jgi:F-type H+-transporting ATPase subunit alpha
MLNEMIEFPNGVFGLALNLEETEVGAILMGDNTLVEEGDEVKTTGRLLSVPVGKALLGRVVNTLGQPLDDKGRSKPKHFIRWKQLHLASSSAEASINRCKPASWRSMP